MVDTSQMHSYHITKQPQTPEGTEQGYTTTSRNIEIAPFMNSCTNIICGDLLRCLCCCCYCLVADNSNCSCSGCDGADCNGCDC